MWAARLCLAGAVLVATSGCVDPEKLGFTACAASGCPTGQACCGDFCLPVGECGGTGGGPGGAGASCARAADCRTGACADGVCCDSTCEGPCDSCARDGSVGLCGPVARGAPGEPSCAPYVCAGSASCPIACGGPLDCTADAFCDVAGHCAPKQLDGASCTGGGQCLSGVCVQGVCRASATDGGAACLTSCGAPGCAGQLCRAAAGPCDLPEVCDAGVCPADVKASVGLTCGPARCLGSSSVAPQVCTGAGSCVLGTASACGDYACVADGGVCRTQCATASDCASGNFCQGVSCVPQLDNGITCTAATQCLSGHCVDGVCCNGACAGGCDSCAQSGSGGTCVTVPRGTTGATPSCAPYTCSGASPACPAACAADLDCEAGFYCTSANACAPKKSVGLACGLATQCQSGFCADAVCCDTACTGSCNACNLTGQLGTCGVLDAGAPGAPACAPYVCDGVSASCPTSCAAPAQCVAGELCVNSACGGKLTNGQACVAGVDAGCASGNCVDGVCCDLACAGVCNWCNVPASLGQCSLNPGASDAGCGSYVCGTVPGCPTTCSLDADCAAGSYCTASSTCAPKLGPGGLCAAGNACQTGQCVEGVCCDSACSGSCRTCRLSRGAPAEGTCSNVTTGTDPKNGCGLYSCAADAGCATSCTGTCLSTCKAGAQCVAGACVAQLAAGSPCDAGCQCTGSACTPFFTDLDTDGYGNPTQPKVSLCGASPPSGFSVDGGDCCDTEGNARPGQTNFFSAPRAGCGGFDYDCSGVEQKQYSSLSNGACTPINSTTCDLGCSSTSTKTDAGWVGAAVPACGTLGVYTTETCTTVAASNPPTCPIQTVCAPSASNTIQRCR